MQVVYNYMMAEDSIIKQLMRASTVGIHLVVATFVGLAIGYFLDKLFGTSPWLTVIFLFLGIVTGFRDLFRMARDSSQIPGGSFDDEKPVPYEDANESNEAKQEEDNGSIL